MGKIKLGLITLIGGAVGGAAALAYRISQETGKTFTEALNEVPEEAQRYWEEIRSRGQEAFAAGREASRAKEADIDANLGGGTTTPPSDRTA